MLVNTKWSKYQSSVWTNAKFTATLRSISDGLNDPNDPYMEVFCDDAFFVKTKPDGTQCIAFPSPFFDCSISPYTAHSGCQKEFLLQQAFYAPVSHIKDKRKQNWNSGTRKHGGRPRNISPTIAFTHPWLSVFIGPHNTLADTESLCIVSDGYYWDSRSPAVGGQNVVQLPGNCESGIIRAATGNVAADVQQHLWRIAKNGFRRNGIPMVRVVTLQSLLRISH